MLHHGVRLLVALLTFTIGIAVVWTLHLIPNLESAILDRFWSVDTSVVSPVVLVSDSAEDANEIYRVLIQRDSTFNDELKLIVIQAETTGCRMYEDESVSVDWEHQTFQEMLKESMPEASPQTLDNYLEANKSPKPLRVANLGINYVLVKESELSHDDIGQFWSRFYKKFPNASGLLFFSDVGFNNRHDQAFVYAGRTCGGLCGSGEYVLLRKINGKWEIQKEQGIWVS